MSRLSGPKQGKRMKRDKSKTAPRVLERGPGGVDVPGTK